MAILCGTDIIEISRVKKSFELTREAFRDKVFTRGEIAYCEGKKVMKYQSYAGRFAAKEAVSKALGTGISQGITWKDIEILNNESGKPEVFLKGRARTLFEELGGSSISISISHCKSYAVAYVVFDCKGQ